MKPFFSIIIPTLNEEKYLPRLLQSLVKQTFRDFELLVVDGNSKDKTFEVFNKFKYFLPSPSFILSPKQNVAYQRNLGAKNSSGRYLIFFDADVILTPTFLEEVHVRAIKKPFLLATTWMMADSKNPIDELMIKLANFGFELAKSVDRPMLSGFNIIVKYEAFKKLNGFREDLLINEDGDFAERAFKKNIELTLLPEPKLAISLRRFKSEGTLQVLRKYAKAQVYSFLKGPITTQIFEYPMGGHVHVLKRKRSNLRKIIRKFNQLMSEI